MKICVVLGLLLATAFAEKKIDLEDIERDNLRAESKSSNDDTRNDDNSYSATVKPETSQQEYRQQQGSHQYQSEEGTSSYVEPQQLQSNYAVQPDEYQQTSKYLENDVSYRQSAQPVQQYVQYLQHQQQQQQQVEPAVSKSLSHASTTYEAPQQQFYYQPEVVVGNQYQSVQQKAATEKYVKNANKENLYVNIPMSHLLSYYPQLAPSQSSILKSEAQPLLHRLATEAARQIKIPVYTPALSTEPIYANSKLAYEIQPQYVTYASKYPKHTEAIFQTKPSKKLIYNQVPLNSQGEQSQPQPQEYLQEVVYAQPGAIYAPVVPTGHREVYIRPTSIYLQGNSVGQSYTSQSGHQRLYTQYIQPERYYAVTPGATSYPSQLSNQILYQHQESAENVQHNYGAIPESPSSGLDLPRLPAKNFKTGGSGAGFLTVSSESDDSHYANNHLVHSSGPKSLLESYIPSRLIAAQDSERYRERPIKLESGFFPSKINFVQTYKKRKVE